MAPERVEELLALMPEGGHFHCHKTLDREPGARAGCAGFNIMSVRTHGGLAKVPRMACAFGLLDFGALMKAAAKPTCQVFADAAGMRGGHAEV